MGIRGPVIRAWSQVGCLLLIIMALPSAALAADRAQGEPVSFGPRAANLYGNGGEVWSLAFSADGKSLAVATGATGQPGDLRFWDLLTGKIGRAHV